jgi:Fe2+ or Zn2+ uptake regulation protein
MKIQRNTVQRKIILDALTKLNTHPTVDEIYVEVHKDHPSISKATVYRGLRTLAQNKLIRQISLSDGLDRYDKRACRHYHFKCKNCGSIFDVEMEYLAGIDETVQQKYGFQIDEHDVVFKGICPQCRETCEEI